MATFYTYELSNTALPIPILPFTPNIDCGDTILYSSTQISGSNASAFISFNSPVRTYIVQTSNYNYIGTYQFKVTAFIDRNNSILVQNSINITVDVVAPPEKSIVAPFFTTALPSVKLYFTSQRTIALPEIKDDQGDKVIISLPNKPGFVILSGTTLSLSPSKNDIGSYKMQIVLADANDTQAMNTYTMQIEVTQNEADSTGVSV